MQYEGYQALRFERLDGDVLKITIAHPASAMNAVDDLLHREFTRLFRELKQESDARAALLTGSGRAFSAGGDFAWFPTLQDSASLEQLRRDAKQLIWDLLEVEIPIVCAMNGAAAGLGASIALLCDIIFMAEDAVVLDPHVKVGIVAGDGGTTIWPMAVGPALAKQYLFTGDPVPAAEAHRIGLVNFVTPPAELEAQALAFARRLAAGAPLAIQYTKQAVNKLIKDNLNIAFDFATALEIVTFKSDDHREALAALQDRRKPVFRGH
ncbi:MAG: enoyl-CoA hydratase-related protein [Pseudomonadales bacterium]